jgi:hypothetical protein
LLEITYLLVFLLKQVRELFIHLPYLLNLAFLNIFISTFAVFRFKMTFGLVVLYFLMERIEGSRRSADLLGLGFLQSGFL